METFPSHKQLLLPVLRAVDHLGGTATPEDVINHVADTLNLPDHIRHFQTEVSGKKTNVFKRRIRWVRQDAIRRGFLNGTSYGLWELTAPGKNFLGNIKPGLVITIFESPFGQALWAEAESAAATIQDSSIDLILTSPEFPLLTPKHYGNREGAEYLDWLTNLATEWKRMLVNSGSLVLNVGPVWQRNQPTQSIYQERLLIRLIDQVGFHLAQRFYSYNPSKIPSSEWVTIRRVRVKNVIEDFWWLSKTPNPKTNTNSVLEPYSERMLKLIAQGGENQSERPSGHGASKGAFRNDNGGSLPTTLLTATNSASNTLYHQKCRAHNLPIHPARFAPSICTFFINLLTDKNDLVYDPLAGSGTATAEAEQLGRRWLSSERALAYISGSKFRFKNYRNLAPQLCAL